MLPRGLKCAWVFISFDDDDATDVDVAAADDDDDDDGCSTEYAMRALYAPRKVLSGETYSSTCVYRYIRIHIYREMYIYLQIHIPNIPHTKRD